MNAYAQAHAVLDAEPELPKAHPLFRAVDSGIIALQGTDYMRASDGSLTPVANIKAADKLEDELVRKVLGFAIPLSEQIARFREHTFADADALVAMLDQEYGVKRGGKAGNLTFTSYDQLMKVEVSRAKIIDFGPSLSQAKELVDQCVADWSGGADANLKAIVTRAFNVENGGLANRNDLLSLLRLDIADDRWRRAMKAIQDAIEVKGTKRYVRIYQRASVDDAWSPVSLDTARA